MMGAGGLDAVRSAVHAVAATTGDRPEVGAGRRLAPVVTISRQAGVAASEVAGRLVSLLNRQDRGDTLWIEYDRRLVERVAADHNLSHDLVSRFDERDRSWFEHFAAGITGDATGTDLAMKTAKTIRGLAWVGRAVIVGRGGVAILAGMRHVVHVRLVAPLAWRAEQHSIPANLSTTAAESALRKIDAERGKYVKQHFGRDVNDPTLYDLTLNVARVSADRAAELIAHAVMNISG